MLAALQVVHAPFMVIHIPAIAERLPPAQRFRHGAGCRHLLSPCIIGIFYHRRTGSVNQLDDIALTVAQVIVFRSVVVDRNRVAGRVVAEQERRGTALHADQHRALVVIVRRDRAARLCDRFALPQSVLVVLKRERGASAGEPHELPSAPCEVIEAVAVRKRIADFVVCDRFTVERRLLIAPYRVFIRVVRGDRRCAEIVAGRVRVVRFVGHVAVRIVRIGDRHIALRVVLADQAVRGIVCIGDRYAAVRDREDIPVVVVSVEIRIVIAVLVRRDQPRGLARSDVHIGDRRFIRRIEPDRLLLHSAERVVGVRHDLTGA